MTVKINFLVHAYNEATKHYTQIALEGLGFRKWGDHVSGKSSVWGQGHSVVIMRESDTTNQFCGFGIDISPDKLAELDTELDEQTGFDKITSPDGLDFFCINTKNKKDIEQQINDNFFNVSTTYANDNNIIESFSGIVINGTVTNEIETFYRNLGFKFKQGEYFDKFTASDNRFTVLYGSINNRFAIYADTHDVFKSCAKLALSHLELRNVSKAEGDFGKKNHLIHAYGLYAYGDQNSYSLEKFISNVTQGMDVIVRERKKRLFINESVIRDHYSYAKQLKHDTS